VFSPDFKLSKAEKVVFNADKNLVYSAHVDNSLRIWKDFKLEGSVDLGGVAVCIAASQSEPGVVYAVLHTSDKLVKVNNGQIEWTHSFDGYEAEVVAHSKMGQTIIVGDKKGTIHFLSEQDPS